MAMAGAFVWVKGLGRSWRGARSSLRLRLRLRLRVVGVALVLVILGVPDLVLRVGG